MNIIITGCTGYIGKILIPKLLKLNFNILAVGRNTEKIRFMFPELKCCNYQELIKQKDNFEFILHLAISNNLKKYNYKKFLETNVVFLKDILKISRKLKIKKFIYLRSIREIDIFDQSNYAKSKREATKILRLEKNLKIETILIPLIYSSNFYPEKISFLNRLPKSISEYLFHFISSIKPTLNVNTLVNHLRKKYRPNSVYLYEDLVDNKFYKIFNILVNLGFSIITIISFFWLLIGVYLIIVIESRGGGLFKQKRIGRNGKEFTLYKFRTMIENTKNVETHKISKEQVTKIGKYLRVLKIDELPQFLNILRGEVSLIGPRPSLISQKELIACRKKKKILTISPGITGWAQVCGIDMSDIKKLVQIEEDYLILRSILFDLKILLYTLVGKGRTDRVK